MCFLELLLLLSQLCNPAVFHSLPNSIIGVSRVSSEFRETYEVSLDTKLHVINVNGDVRLQGWDKEYVEVYAEKRTPVDENELAKVEIEVVIHDIMQIRTRLLEKHAQVAVDYSINVPRHLLVEKVSTFNGEITLKNTTGDVEVLTANGDIALENIAGDVRAKTSNGDVSVRGANGVVEAYTSNGNLNIEIRDIPDQGTEIATSNGSIDLYVNDGLHADLRATTSMGKVSVDDAALKSRLTYNADNPAVLEATIGAGGKKINVATSNGDVRLHSLFR